MAVLEIVTYPHPILLSEAQTVKRITRRVRRLARDMLETMYAAPAVRPEDRLSLPDLVGEVCRAQWVTAKGLDRRGKPITVEGEGLLARALQHEVDHLNSTLFVARIEDPTLIWKVSELKATVQREIVHI
jgi:peptide deformylase